MADLLALDWEKRQLCGIDAQVSKGRVRARRCFVLSWPEGLNVAADPQQAGQWLREELQRLGCADRTVMVSLPRESAVVRQLELPAAPDDELPDLVRLQAETKLSSSLDRLLLDFLPVPYAAASPTRNVLLVTIPREMSSRIQKVIEAAGLEPASIGLSPCGAAELVAGAEARRGDDASETSLIVARYGRRVEISLMRARRLLFTHSSQLAGESEQEDNQLVMAEVSRSFVALERLMAVSKPERTWVLGSEVENDALCRLLTERLGGETAVLDPLVDMGLSAEAMAESVSRTSFAGPAGLLLSAAGATVEHIDFLNPRKSVPKADRRTLRISLAAAAVLIALVGYGAQRWRLSSLDARISDLRAENQELDEELTSRQPLLESAATVGEWARRDVDWLDRLRELNRLFPGTDRIYFTEFTFMDGSDKASAGRIRASGFAANRTEIARLKQRLAENNYIVRPTEDRRNEKDARYPYQCELDFELPMARREGT